MLQIFLKKYKIEYKEEHVQPLLYGLKSDAAEYRRLKEQLAKAKEADARCRELQDEIRKFGLGFGIRFDGEIISELNRIWNPACIRPSEHPPAPQKRSMA